MQNSPGQGPDINRDRDGNPAGEEPWSEATLRNLNDRLDRANYRASLAEHLVRAVEQEVLDIKRELRQLELAAKPHEDSSWWDYAGLAVLSTAVVSTLAYVYRVRDRD
eukprot:jgi/Mesvir1/24684/Mv21976-RA.1